MPTLTLSPRQLFRAFLTVFLGGALGTAVRDLTLKISPPVTCQRACASTVSLWQSVPWTLLIINAVGVFVAAGLLHTVLRARDPNTLSRLFLITGLLGGFTSYSTLIADLAALWPRSASLALLTGVVAIGSGVVAGTAGLRLPRR